MLRIDALLMNMAAHAKVHEKAHIFQIFYWCGLKMGVLVHPHSEMLCGASLPCFVCFFDVAFVKKHMCL